MIPQALQFAKPILAIMVAAMSYVAEATVSQLENVPSWIDRYGLPMVFLAAVIYALVSTNKALRASEEGRLRDRDEFMKQIREDAEKASQSRERLKESTDRQTIVFERLVGQLESRPCQKEK